MAHRTFLDPAGSAWLVWDTYPASLRGRLGVVDAFAAGWLCFDRAPSPARSTPEKRRLAPIPAGWADFSEARLQALLATASAVVPRRLGPSRAP